MVPSKVPPTMSVRYEMRKVANLISDFWCFVNIISHLSFCCSALSEVDDTGFMYKGGHF